MQSESKLAGLTRRQARRLLKVNKVPLATIAASLDPPVTYSAVYNVLVGNSRYASARIRAVLEQKLTELQQQQGKDEHRAA